MVVMKKKIVIVMLVMFILCFAQSVFVAGQDSIVGDLDLPGKPSCGEAQKFMRKVGGGVGGAVGRAGGYTAALMHRAMKLQKEAKGT